MSKIDIVQAKERFRRSPMTTETRMERLKEGLLQIFDDLVPGCGGRSFVKE